MKNHKYKNINIDHLTTILIHNDVEEINKKNYFMTSFVSLLTSKGHICNNIDDVKIKFIRKGYANKATKEQILKSKDITQEDFNLLMEK